MRSHHWACGCTAARCTASMSSHRAQRCLVMLRTEDGDWHKHISANLWGLHLLSRYVSIVRLAIQSASAPSYCLPPKRVPAICGPLRRAHQRRESATSRAPAVSTQQGDNRRPAGPVLYSPDRVGILTPRWEAEFMANPQPASQMTLAESIDKRTSVRAYTGEALRPEHLAALESMAVAAPRLPGGPVRFAFVTDPAQVNRLLRGLVGNYGKVKDAPALLLGIVEQGPHAEQGLGFTMEHLILEATRHRHWHVLELRNVRPETGRRGGPSHSRRKRARCLAARLSRTPQREWAGEIAGRCEKAETAPRDRLSQAAGAGDAAPYLDSHPDIICRSLRRSVGRRLGSTGSPGGSSSKTRPCCLPRFRQKVVWTMASPWHTFQSLPPRSVSLGRWNLDVDADALRASLQIPAQIHPVGDLPAAAIKRKAPPQRIGWGEPVKFQATLSELLRHDVPCQPRVWCQFFTDERQRVVDRKPA